MPDGAWFCQACSDASALAQGVAFRVGQEAKCLDSLGLRHCMVVVDSIQPESVLVHFQVSLTPTLTLTLTRTRTRTLTLALTLTLTLTLTLSRAASSRTSGCPSPRTG